MTAPKETVIAPAAEGRLVELAAAGAALEELLFRFEAADTPLERALPAAESPFASAPEEDLGTSGEAGRAEAAAEAASAEMGSAPLV